MKSSGRTIALFTLTAALLVASISLAKAAPAEPDGASLFKDHKCIMCHGADGKGFAAIHTPNFTDPKWQAGITDKEIANVIENGKPNTLMKPNGGGPALSESEVQVLVKYIRSLNSEKKGK